MVFKAQHAHTWKLKFAIPTRHGGKARTFSTGATSKAVAQDVERVVDRLKGRREWDALEAVFDGRLSLAEVYDADLRGTLAERLDELGDVDLDALVTEWAKRANAIYVRQVRAFVVEGERFPASRFRRKAISEFLATLPHAEPTKNRYRAALSVFAKWLVEREVLDGNPVRDVAMYKERDPRMIWMTWEQAQRVADAAHSPYRELYALMAATGMEISAALSLTRDAIDLTAQTIHAQGSKTAWRNRVVRYEPWAQGYVFRLIAGRLPTAPLFAGISRYMALWHFRAAQQAVGLTGHHLHDLRHTYAVNALRKGYKPQVIAHQLGHRDATMVHKVYGRFVPDETDYVVTNVVTTPKKQREVKRAKS